MFCHTFHCEVAVGLILSAALVPCRAPEVNSRSKDESRYQASHWAGEICAKRNSARQ
jgi:hypothetical protein